MFQKIVRKSGTLEQSGPAGQALKVSFFVACMLPLSRARERQPIMAACPRQVFWVAVSGAPVIQRFWLARARDFG
jgi:hypothetical protein